MASSKPVACGACGGKGMQTLKEGVWENNPVSIQMLGICSALAVTTRLENSLVMGVALMFVCGVSGLAVSLLRKAMPGRIRLIAEMAVISTLVIIVDQLLKGFYWPMSRQLGPYVALIITNCIVLGRLEAFALQNPPPLSFVDGVANGAGYAAVLAIIGIARELLGAGSLFGREILSANWFTPNQVMILAPGAFIAIGFLIAAYNWARGPQGEEKAK